MLPFNASIQRSNAITYENGLDLELSCRFYQDLIKSLSTSNNRFVKDLAPFVYVYNQRPLQDDQVAVYKRTSQDDETNGQKSFRDYLLNYFLSSIRIQPLWRISQKEILGQFNITTKHILSDDYFTHKRIESLFTSIQKIDLNDMMSVHRRDRLPLQIYPGNDIFIRIKNCTIFYGSNKEFETFVSVLDKDYSKSSEGYTRKNKEHERSGTEANGNPAHSYVETSDSDDFSVSGADDFSVSGADDDNYCSNTYYNGEVSRYFENIDSNCNEPSKFLKSNTDDCVIFGDDVKDYQWNDNLTDSLFDDVFLPNGTSDHGLPTSFDFEEGFENPCFEDDLSNNELLDDCAYTLGEYSYIKMINANWKINMKNVSQEPRVAEKVSFQTESSLVTVRNFEPEDDGYRYSIYVLNQLRFQNRIQEFEIIMAPFLTQEHRERMFRRNKEGFSMLEAGAYIDRKHFIF